MNSTLWIQDSTYSRLPIIRTIKGNKKFELSRAKLYRKDLEGSSYQFYQWNVVSRFQLLVDSGLQSHISLHEA